MQIVSIRVKYFRHLFLQVFQLDKMKSADSDIGIKAKEGIIISTS
jgi:hypothetical protein